jgi:hypothetical protein
MTETSDEFQTEMAEYKKLVADVQTQQQHQPSQPQILGDKGNQYLARIVGVKKQQRHGGRTVIKS